MMMLPFSQLKYLYQEVKYDYTFEQDCERYINIKFISYETMKI
jgi:hypothetical protein